MKSALPSVWPVALLALLAVCGSDTAGGRSGLCGRGGTCPDGQACGYDGYCRSTGAGDAGSRDAGAHDAEVGDAADGLLDAATDAPSGPSVCPLGPACAEGLCCAPAGGACVAPDELPADRERLARGDHGAVWVPGATPAMIVFGGYDGDGGGPNPYRNDVWVLSAGASPSWTHLAPEGDPPAPRGHAAVVWDPDGQRLVIFGGVTQVAVQSDVWELVFRDAEAPLWRELHPEGESPEPLWAHAAVLDPDGHRMIVFGGRTGDAGKVLENAVSSLSLEDPPAWERLAPEGDAPVPRYSHAVAWDPAGRMLVHGGRNSAGQELADLWALSVPAGGGDPRWTELTAGGATPGGRTEHSLVFDPGSDRAVLYGGVHCEEGGFCADAWELVAGADDAVWTRLEPQGVAPTGRTRHSAVMDPEGSRMIVFGAALGGTSSNETWGLSLPRDGAPSWSSLAPACAGAAADDPEGGGPQ